MKPRKNHSKALLSVSVAVLVAVVTAASFMLHSRQKRSAINERSTKYGRQNSLDTSSARPGNTANRADHTGRDGVENAVELTEAELSDKEKHALANREDTKSRGLAARRPAAGPVQDLTGPGWIRL